MKKDTFTATVTNFYSEVYYFVVRIPAARAAPFLEGKSKRVVCHLNEKIQFQAGLLPDGDGDFYITLNKENRKALNLGENENVEVRLEKDDSKYGLPMPEEMEALLEMDIEGDKYFHALTSGKQRSLLFIIGKPKTSDTRLRKAIVVVDYLKMTKGKLDYKELNQAFKDAK